MISNNRRAATTMQLSRFNDEGDDDVITACAVALAGAYYASVHYNRQPCRTSLLNGAAWVSELIKGNPSRIFESFRMTRSAFSHFCRELDFISQKSPWSRVDVAEQAAIFLYAMAHNATNRELQERFQRSGETIHRYVNMLQA